MSDHSDEIHAIPGLIKSIRYSNPISKLQAPVSYHLHFLGMQIALSFVTTIRSYDRQEKLRGSLTRQRDPVSMNTINDIADFHAWRLIHRTMH